MQSHQRTTGFLVKGNLLSEVTVLANELFDPFTLRLRRVSLAKLQSARQLLDIGGSATVRCDVVVKCSDFCRPARQSPNAVWVERGRVHNDGSSPPGSPIPLSALNTLHTRLTNEGPPQVHAETHPATEGQEAVEGGEGAGK